MLVGAHNVQ